MGQANAVGPTSIEGSLFSSLLSSSRVRVKVRVRVVRIRVRLGF